MKFCTKYPYNNTLNFYFRPTSITTPVFAITPSKSCTFPFHKINSGPRKNTSVTYKYHATIVHNPLPTAATIGTIRKQLSFTSC